MVVVAIKVTFGRKFLKDANQRKAAFKREFVFGIKV